MLEDIKSNITRLIALYEGERQKTESLESALAQRDTELLACKQQIKDLNGQIDNMKLLYAFSGSGDSALAKERIAKLIREIDKCINLLEN